MAESTKEKLIRILAALRSNNDGIEGAALLSPEGSLMADDFPTGSRREQMTAVWGALLELGKKTNTALEHGGFCELHLKGAAHTTVLYGLEPAVLALRLEAQSNLGMINLAARDAAEEIRLLFAGEEATS